MLDAERNDDEKPTSTSTQTDSPPWNEQDRLAALARYDVLDTPAEAGFDDLVNVLARVCNVPIGLVSLVQTDRQWFKAETGLGLSETPIEQSMCVKAMRSPDVTVVPDTRLDARFASNSLVTGGDPMLFYAGAPLLTEEGLPLGMLCVLDRAPRPQGLSADQVFVMKALAGQVMAQLELRRSVAQRRRVEAALRKSEQDHRQILESAIDYAIVTMDLTGQVTSWSAGAVRRRCEAGRHTCSSPRRTGPRRFPRRRWATRCSRGAATTSAGICARTAPASGRAAR
jgi:PAS domain-containing protein